MGLLTKDISFTATKNTTTTCILPMFDRPVQNLTVWVDSLGQNVSIVVQPKLAGVNQGSATTITAAQAFSKVYNETGWIPKLANYGASEAPPLTVTASDGVTQVNTYGYQLVLSIQNTSATVDALLRIHVIGDRGIND